MQTGEDEDQQVHTDHIRIRLHHRFAARQADRAFEREITPARDKGRHHDRPVAGPGRGQHRKDVRKAAAFLNQREESIQEDTVDEMKHPEMDREECQQE